MKILEKKKVLIVEDDQYIADVLHDRLVLEGFSVYRASSGETGYQLALTHHPDLILLDIIMPKLDGISMLEKLRRDYWGKNAVVILLTNIGRQINPTENVSLTVHDYIVKAHCKLDDVIHKVKNTLKGTAKRQKEKVH